MLETKRDDEPAEEAREHSAVSEAHAIVLGTAQDGGFPHAGCSCEHCGEVRGGRAVPRRVACLGLVSGTAAASSSTRPPTSASR